MPAIIIGAFQTIEVDIADTFNDNHVQYSTMAYCIQFEFIHSMIVSYSSIDCLK